MKREAVSRILLLVCNKFDKFKNIGAQMQDSLHHKMLKVFCNLILKIKIIIKDFAIYR